MKRANRRTEVTVDDRAGLRCTKSRLVGVCAEYYVCQLTGCSVYPWTLMDYGTSCYWNLLENISFNYNIIDR